jgi:hypothetical protein
MFAIDIVTIIGSLRPEAQFERGGTQGTVV